MKISDLIGPETKIVWYDNVGKMYGEAKQVTEPWTAFGDKNNTGHFVPVILNGELIGKDLIVGGRTDGDRTVTVDEDQLLIVRLENLSGDTMTLTDATARSAEPLLTLDFSAMTKPSFRVLDPDDDTGYQKKASELMDGVSAEWSGTDCKVTGLIKFVEDWQGLPESANKSGHYFAFKFDQSIKEKPFSYTKGKDAESMTEGGSTKSAGDDELFWVLRVDENKVFEFKSNNKVIAKIDLTGATFSVPAKVLPQDHDLGKFKKIVNELVADDVKINADGSVEGTFHHIDAWKECGGKSGWFLPIRFVGDYKDKLKEVTVTKTNKATDEDWIINVNENSTVNVTIDGVAFKELTFKTATFEPKKG